MKKKILIGLGIIVVIGIIANLGSKDEEKPTTEKAKQETVTKKETNKESVDKTEESKKPAATDTGDLGDYHVTIKNLELAKDYEGSDVGVVTYEFTNNGDENAMFMTEISDKAFQNGVGLSLAIMSDSGYVDSMTEIQPGATLELKVPYKLSDTTSPVSVEVSKLFGNKEKLKKDFTLQ
ncbi:hypothetical protein RV11_GL000012 [Enterococcus phoeniculicola]|jgi:hypothetical protein|uniref:DUF5067 domain-containing protein n=1 Tax=Enterococcus phoeniculicola ATCC BAA-412 TaxID=1158610 RepID=R3WDN1_9ENTE|nr:DUF5067 domain-containing protein [Enterococcus phoeniculicola]EOL45547.1 hypothetical protein UC3_01437 [Enterococcus phoeniculicola ATCC BAA-412]EOT74909.1 hypothetical protein I589_02509 [Enterococcus phoeniculicola ATCC BAA-412]OJG73646.1 hypothetical protein RV11_GL000012 [Enterococcus phoeniculicola]